MGIPLNDPMLSLDPAPRAVPPRSEWVVRLVSIGFVVTVGYLLFETLSPFFSVLAWAAILSYALYPLHRRVVVITRGRRNLSALIMCLAVTIGLILPALYLSLLIGEEVARNYQHVVTLLERGQSFILHHPWKTHPLVESALDRLHAYERMTGTNLRAMVVGNLSAMGGWAVQQLTQVAANLLLGFVQLAFILVCSFYLFRDGETFVRWIRDALPFRPDRQEHVLKRFDEVMIASVYGNTLIALAEGLLGGLAFLLAGIPSPVLWGALMGLSAYIPLIGASTIWVPASAWLFYQGRYAPMATVIAAGLIIVYLDYIVRSVVVGDRSKLHPLLVLLSVLGGIKFFGLVGLVAGPLVVAFAKAVLDLYREARLSWHDDALSRVPPATPLEVPSEPFP
jgi:predicted PurR-regulated permease PerM